MNKLLCPNCQQTQPDHVKFCGNCGHAMTQQPVRSLWGLPIFGWLLAAGAIAILALFLTWYPTQFSSSVSWKTTGYEYSDGSRSTWQVPVGSTSSYGGGNGLNFFTLALAATIAGLGIGYRNGNWPRWAGWTLAVIVGLVIFIGLINVSVNGTFGPLLYALAGGLAVPAAIQILRGTKKA